MRWERGGRRRQNQLPEPCERTKAGRGGAKGAKGARSRVAYVCGGSDWFGGHLETSNQVELALGCNVMQFAQRTDGDVLWGWCRSMGTKASTAAAAQLAEEKEAQAKAVWKQQPQELTRQAEGHALLLSEPVQLKLKRPAASCPWPMQRFLTRLQPRRQQKHVHARWTAQAGGQLGVSQQRQRQKEQEQKQQPVPSSW